MRGLNERNSELWESKLDSMMDDPFLIQLIPELTWRSGISNKSMKRLLLLAHTGKMNFLDFYWLGLGQRVNSIDEDLFLELVNYLLVQNNARATSIVLEIFHRYYLSKKSKSRFPKEFTNSLLTHQTLFTRDARSQFHTMDYYYWELIGLAYIKDYPDEGLKLASTILEHFGEEGTIVTYTGYRPVKILINIAHHDPERLWNLVSGFLEPPIKSDNFWILNWLRGNDDYGDEKDGAFSLFPDKLIWNWIDESPDERAPFLARHVPNSLHVREEAICLAREILVRYGNREDVERELIANFSTEGWTGSRSFHIRKKIKDLESFKELEDNHNVISWVDGYIVILKDEYEDARIEEERRYR